ncbi:peptidylprolyl isomerase [Geminocystis herdmanii]|uniref:peptidylprolyl isomerase n=1 Tax=Geminocystis herdmanii TaxID=669359 RepID=UPI0003497CE8|nr:peptidylprolyl isomerase [Geminocystis herdmanii]
MTININPFNTLVVNANSNDTILNLFQYFDDPFTTGKIATFNLYDNNLGNGEINVLLFDQNGEGAPLTVNNFLQYVDDNAYVNSIIHRSLPNFVIQGGGFTTNNLEVNNIQTNPPVVNEFSSNRSNTRGTIAMAKLGGDPNSATSQWFFNVANNASNLDYQNGGFTVFGEVLSGNDLNTIDSIASLSTIDARVTNPAFTNLPVINSPVNDDNDLVRFENITVTDVPELSFTIQNNTNPSLVTSTINNQGEILFDYHSNTNGVAEITIQATNLLGETQNNTVRVLVLVTDDTLDGGTGADSMVGGAGNDTYYVDNVNDVVIERLNEGIDTVISTITYTLPNHVENLTLSGTANINGTGNTLNNIISGNSGNNKLSGGGGNDTLNGGTGADTMFGGSGDDLYYVDNTGDRVIEKANQGIDTVISTITYTLPNHVENLTLSGSANLNGTGNGLNNVIRGNSGNNILNGGAGADTMRGGAGNDTYYVDNTGDRVIENVNQGTDTVRSTITYTLPNHVEYLILTGAANINGTGNTLDNRITGNSGNNRLIGGDGNDTLIAGAGNDTLSGGVGADSMVGGLGNDLYGVDHPGDVIVEALNGGIDTVNSSITYTLPDNVENLKLTGTTNISGTGNILNNVITGNSGNNRLNGGDGNDTLIGGEGNDTLSGGVGADSMVGGSGNDLYGVDHPGDVIVEALNGGIDTVNSSITYTLGANLENLTLTGTTNISGTGNILNNVIRGNSGNNRLNGGDGNDTLIGGEGNDTLSGGVGADSMVGGSGNDLYGVDHPGDVIVEALNGGIDTVNSSITYTLGANLENLTLTGTTNISGTGNILNNVITGNSGNNRLIGGDGNDTLIGGAGNDTLSGGTGADSMIGGLGNDLYGVDHPGDMIVEALNGGIDTVNSSITYTLGANLENLTLTGTTNISGTGNTLNNVIIGNSGNNILTGGAGNDTLTGGGGNDTLIGGIGNDTLTGGSGNDFFRFNSSNEGLDRITDFSVIDDTILISRSGFGGGLTVGTLLSTQFIIGASATTSAHRFIYNSSTGGLFFDVDGSGATSAVQFATLSTGLALTNADIVVI